MEIVIANDANNYGGEARWLTETTGDGLAFRFMRSIHIGDRVRHVARHRHPFAQLRWAERGPRPYGLDQFIPEGDIAYFPRGAYYGPEVLGDIAGATDTTLQFGFEPEYGPMRGEVEWRLLRNGVDPAQIAAKLPSVEVHAISETDPTWNNENEAMDAWRVTPRAVAGRGQGPEIAPGGYDGVVLMHPPAFQYVEEAPGVEVRRLGCFYDYPGPNGDMRLTMIRLSNSGVYPLSADRGQLAWSISPGLKVDGRSFPAITSLYSSRNEEVELAADSEPVEAFVVDFPRPD